MSLPIAHAKTLTRWILCFAAGSAVVFLLLLAAQSALDPFFCPTETLATLSGVSGFDFEISRTDCDVIAKEEWISVFASKPGRADRTLVFEYDPFWYDRIPTITPVNQQRVKISMPRISSVRFQRGSWEELPVVYDIGLIEYPGEVSPEGR